MNKKKYIKPQMNHFGSIEEVTGWVGGGCGEFLGGAPGQMQICAPKKKHNVFPDFGS